MNAGKWRAAPLGVGGRRSRIIGSNCVRLNAGFGLAKIVFIVLFKEPCRAKLVAE